MSQNYRRIEMVVVDYQFPTYMCFGTFSKVWLFRALEYTRKNKTTREKHNKIWKRKDIEIKRNTIIAKTNKFICYVYINIQWKLYVFNEYFCRKKNPIIKMIKKEVFLLFPRVPIFLSSSLYLCCCYHCDTFIIFSA